MELLSTLRLSSAEQTTGARTRAVLVGAAVFGLLVGAGASNGGYYPGSWGWLTLASAWIAALALILDRPDALSRAGTTTLALLTAFAGWNLLSAAWSIDVTQTALAAQRNVVYAVGFGALLVLARRSAATVLEGAWAATAALCLYALLTRLVPDRFGVIDPVDVSHNRLGEPLGYWNSLGLLATLGMLLALALAARGRGSAVRASAAASLPLLATTAYYTFSRGAWLALAAGLAVAVAFDERRLQQLATAASGAVWAALAVFLASRSDALTSQTSPLTVQAHDGHRLCLVLLLLTAASGATTLALAAAERRVTVPAAVRRRIGQASVAAAAAALVAVFAVGGAPWTLASRAWHSFESPPVVSNDLNQRFFTLSANYRLTFWRIALHDELAAHPALGSGAGSFERVYLQHRTTPGKVRNAHSLYVETLATLGPFGLLILAAALLVPLGTALRTRARPFVPLAAGAWVAFLVHVAGDWDWQVTAVTLVALAAAAVLVSPGESVRLGAPARRLGIGAAVVAAGVGVYTIAAQLALSRIDAHAADPARAASEARSASRLQPWSTEPWQRLAEVDLATSHFRDAAVALHTAVAKDPKDWSLWYELGRATTDVQRIEALREATRLNPHSPEVARLRALIASLSRSSSP